MPLGLHAETSPARSLFRSAMLSKGMPVHLILAHRRFDMLPSLIDGSKGLPDEPFEVWNGRTASNKSFQHEPFATCAPDPQNVRMDPLQCNLGCN